MNQNQDIRITSKASDSSNSNPIRELYNFLGNTKFAIFVIIALAIASLVGIYLVDQVPYRGEMATRIYADRQHEPLIWVLTNLVPARPFSCPGYQTLLALLSLSLIVCITKRWRWQWSRALSLRPLQATQLDNAAALEWTTATAPSESDLAGFLKQKWFKQKTSREGGNFLLTASKFSFAKLGSLFTHAGFLFLVTGGLWMTTSGSSTTIWLSTGDKFELPHTKAILELVDFEIKTNHGKIADYVSDVKLWQDDRLVKEMEIEVNKPLRYRGYSLYQASYRTDPVSFKSLDLLYETASASESDPPGDLNDSEAAAHSQMGGHSGNSKPKQFINPATITLKPNIPRKIPGSIYSTVIDTFLADFRIGENGPFLGSNNPDNPAVLLNFFAGDSLVGSSWLFQRHPDMVVGSKPADLNVRFASYDPITLTGLELATHPGSGIVWLGFAIMTLGTLLSFLLRHEEIFLRVRPRESNWDIAVIHRGSSTLDPELVSKSWETTLSPLTASMLKKWPPVGGKPHRLPFSKQTKPSRG